MFLEARIQYRHNVIIAKFRFELSNQTDTVDNSERKKLKALDIQFV